MNRSVTTALTLALLAILLACRMATESDIEPKRETMGDVSLIRSGTAVGP